MVLKSDPDQWYVARGTCQIISHSRPQLLPLFPTFCYNGSAVSRYMNDVMLQDQTQNTKQKTHWNNDHISERPLMSFFGFVSLYDRYDYITKVLYQQLFRNSFYVFD